MRPVVLGKLDARGCLLPKLEMPIDASSNEKILGLCYSHLCDCISVHKTFLIHLRTGQCSKVSLLVLENLQDTRLMSCDAESSVTFLCLKQHRPSASWAEEEALDQPCRLPRQLPEVQPQR